MRSAHSTRIAKGEDSSMNPNQALWEKGDFTQIADTMRESGEALAKGLGITKGLKVLDLGCGDGTTALPEAKLGADVLGVDIASNLVEAGNRRARAAGLTNCRFQQGDASDLHELNDQTFDLVVSIFGAMFAPKPFDVAKEMVRVTRPGGRIVMGNWIPNDPTLVAQILKISSSYSPPPPEGFISPMTWGIESNVIERFAGAGVPAERISFVKDTFTFNFTGTPSEFVTRFRKYYGPTMNAFDAAEKNGRADDLQRELEALFSSQNTEPTAGCDLHSGDVPARERGRLSSSCIRQPFPLSQGCEGGSEAPTSWRSSRYGRSSAGRRPDVLARVGSAAARRQPRAGS